jgi:hypothetical protein
MTTTALVKVNANYYVVTARVGNAVLRHVLVTRDGGAWSVCAVGSSRARVLATHEDAIRVARRVATS